MQRLGPSQPDLFAATTTPEVAPARAPLAELADLLVALRAAERLPWADAAAAMAEERRVLGLARLAGVEGDRLATEILRETERLFSAAERNAALAPSAPSQAGVLTPVSER